MFHDAWVKDCAQNIASFRGLGLRVWFGSALRGSELSTYVPQAITEVEMWRATCTATRRH